MRTQIRVGGSLSPEGVSRHIVTDCDSSVFDTLEGESLTLFQGDLLKRYTIKKRTSNIISLADLRYKLPETDEASNNAQKHSVIICGVIAFSEMYDIETLFEGETDFNVGK